MRVRIPAVVASIALMLGTFAATTPAVAAPGCPAYNVCLYQNANFTGHYVFISNGSGTPDYRVVTWDDYPSQSVNDRVSSVINNGTGWFYAYRDINYAGPWRESFPPGDHTASVVHNDAFSSSVSHCTC